MKQVLKLVKIGPNSVAVVIKKDILEKIGAKLGDYVEIDIKALED
ncbi:MAG: AbrB/MazE/SpoVT family DNA-binding domain-containing protein [Cetobacterium sp.]